MTIDEKWREGGADTEHSLHPLHKKLYGRGVKHAGDCYYALVGRVALGEPTITKAAQFFLSGEGETTPQRRNPQQATDVNHSLGK